MHARAVVVQRACGTVHTAGTREKCHNLSTNQDIKRVTERMKYIKKVCLVRMDFEEWEVGDEGGQD